MQALKRFINRLRSKSPWLLHFDCGSCNGCDIEILACLTPSTTWSASASSTWATRSTPTSCSLSGTVNHRNKKVLANLYAQMPSPKLVVAIGACGLSGGIFREAYNVVGGIDKVIPVDVYVPGCPPKPEAIIDGVVLGLQKLQGLHEQPSVEKGLRDHARRDHTRSARPTSSERWRSSRSRAIVS